ncbi:MAG: hypothetical protein ACI9VX_002200 [Dinoroseobacter sp.]|jgi:hypothetical protein
MGTPVPEDAHTLSPSFVAAGLKRVAHQGFDVLLTNPVFAFYIGKADVVRQCHLDNFANVIFGKVWCFCHNAPRKRRYLEGKHRLAKGTFS